MNNDIHHNNTALNGDSLVVATHFAVFNIIIIIIIDLLSRLKIYTN